MPVTVWVGPSGGGARGASALLARSAGFAAVAPGAHLGPVDPIRYDDTSFTVDAPLKDVTEKASTLLEFIGLLDGRTIQTAAGPVKLSTIKVVELNGRQVREPTGEVHFRKLGLSAQIAHTLNAPWVAYFLFVAGLALIVFEFFSVGVGVAGFVGAVALIGACFGFSHLPVAPWAVALLLLGMFGMSIDVQAGTLGPWTFIGAGSLVAGSIWLFGGSSHLDPAWWVLVRRHREHRGVHALGHDRDGAFALLDADDRSRGARRRDGSRRSRRRSRRCRAHPRRAVARAHEPGHADPRRRRGAGGRRSRASCWRSSPKTAGHAITASVAAAPDLAVCLGRGPGDTFRIVPGAAGYGVGRGAQHCS